MSSVTAYFKSRIGKAMAWSFEAGGAVHRRDYSIVVKGVDRDSLVAAVEAHDYGRDGKRMTRVPRELGVVRVPTAEIASPIDALEDIARKVDPSYFEGHPRAERSSTETSGATLGGKIAALAKPEGRGADEAAPTAGSIERFKKFWEAQPGLLTPDLFSSKDGTLRARWQDGSDRTLWINFPEKGLVGWSVSVPRQGTYGLAKLHARCPDERDIVPMAKLLGVRAAR